MQILRWLFKQSHDHRKQALPPATSKRLLSAVEDNNKERETKVEFEEEEEEDENNNTFTILLTRGGSRTWFYSYLNLKYLRNFHEYNSSLGVFVGGELGMGHLVESAGHVGCKVLPICDAGITGSSSSESGDGSETDVQKGSRDRRKTIARMKELWRWAAATKPPKGNKAWKLLYFRNKGTTHKAPIDELSSSSSKISIRWDVSSCSAASSVCSPLSMASSRTDQLWAKNTSNPTSKIIRKSDCDTDCPSSTSPKAEECQRRAHWINTDSDFVVLEL